MLTHRYELVWSSRKTHKRAGREPIFSRKVQLSNITPLGEGRKFFTTSLTRVMHRYFGSTTLILTNAARNQTYADGVTKGKQGCLAAALAGLGPRVVAGQSWKASTDHAHIANLALHDSTAGKLISTDLAAINKIKTIQGNSQGQYWKQYSNHHTGQYWENNTHQKSPTRDRITH